jgi:hypothetical protein
MAKIKYSALVSDMRNKLNGSVMSKNRYGSYVRNKVTPTNPQTTSQVAARNRLATWSQGWRGITQAQRQGWITGASGFPIIDIFGDSKILAGNALYTQLNVNLALIGATDIDDLPTPVAIPAITALSLSATSGTPAFSVVFAPTPVPAGFKMLVEATPPMPPSRLFVKNQFRVLATIAAAATSPYNGLTAYAAKFGNPVIGKVIYIRVRYISSTTGQAGIPVQASFAVVA